ncbi:uncharacterized protein [Littorina saxatilis]|uniref:uncharacterized protein n=1 Tax=Littorina saxatilis TaxID=31220 RepID=UPI0038B62648
MRLPTFDDDKDELDDFLRRFERLASDQRWEEDTWASRLSTCLKGRALQLYNALDDDEARNYQALKKALLQRFNLTAEAYRRRLRNCKRLSGELSHQFVARLNLYLRRWVEMAEKNWTVDDLADLIVMKQLMSSLRPEVVTFVQEHQPKTTQEAANWIRVHEDAQAISGKSSGPRPGKSGNSGSSGPKDGKDDQGHKGSSSRSDILCFYCNKRGHVKKDCHKRQSDQKGVHFVGSEEFRDVTSTCTIPQLCVPCSRKHFQPHCNVYVNGVKGEGLRDTGADMIVVRASLVPAMAYTGDSIRVRMAEASHAYDMNTAVIKVVTPLFTGTIVAVVMDDPPCDLLIGNRVQFVDGVTREVPVYRSPDVISVLTRARAERENKPLKPLPAVRATLGNVTPALLAKAQESDPTLATPREHAKSGKVKLSRKHGKSKFLREKKLLYREFSNREGSFKQVVVPREFREGVMATAHDSILGGHLGTKKTTDRVWRHFYWPGICTDIRRFCASCDKCQKVVAKGRWQGPFEVTAKVGQNDYRIVMNGKARLYHANLLRAYIERTAYGEKNKDEKDKDKETEKVAVVMDETTEEPGGGRVPVCPLEASETYTDVHISVELGDDQQADLQEILKDAARVLTDIPLQTHLDEFTFDLLEKQPVRTKHHLAKAKYFSKLDLTKGYWQIPVAEEDRLKTAFTTPFGQFQWTVMPFGLQNAGAVFTRMMRTLLEPLKREDISSFIDDVLIATETWSEHLDTLRDVFRSSAFNTLKRRLTSQPILRLPDLKKDFVLRTDASGKRLGAVLLQETEGFLHPVCFASRKLTLAEAAYATVERECLAIVWGIQKFEAYLPPNKPEMMCDEVFIQLLPSDGFWRGFRLEWACCFTGYPEDDIALLENPGTVKTGKPVLRRCGCTSAGRVYPS